MSIIVTLIGALLGLATGPASAQSQVMVFKDWVVACDNTRHCEAVGYQADEAQPPVSLWLGRDAGPGTAIHARLTALPEDGGDTGPLTIHAGPLSASGIQPDGELTAEQVATLLPALLEATAAEITDGRSRWTLSLSGIKAALLYLDDQQGRVGSAGATVKKGPKPESAVPPAKPAPVVTVAKLPPQPTEDPALLAAVLGEIQPRDCVEGIPEDQQPSAGLTRLSANQVLVLRECGRGAYQGEYAAWIASPTPPHRPQQIRFPTESGETIDRVIEADFGDGILHSYAKGRGLGDCGEFRNWAWTGKGFELIEASEAPLCRGMAGGGFSLRTWTATVVR